MANTPGYNLSAYGAYSYTDYNGNTKYGFQCKASASTTSYTNAKYVRFAY